MTDLADTAASRKDGDATVGMVFAATGPHHVMLARGAARSVREHHPDVEIDLFTDMPDEADTDLFSRVVPITDAWCRSKIDAMLATRFDRTIYLDADVLVVTAIDDLFDLLDRFDIALAQDQEANSDHAMRIWRHPLPPCFPQLNSGVVVYRSNPEVLALLHTWRNAVQSEAHRRDQPVLRELVWQSNLRLAVLPPQYNFTQPQDLVMFRGNQIAPRIIHGLGFRDGPSPSFRLRRQITGIVEAMTAGDQYLAHRNARSVFRTSGIRKRILQLRALLALTYR